MVAMVEVNLPLSSISRVTSKSLSLITSTHQVTERLDLAKLIALRAKSMLKLTTMFHLSQELNWKLLSTKHLSLSQLTPMRLFSIITRVELWTPRIVELPSTMPSLLLGMDLRTERSTTSSETLGEPRGEIKVTSRLLSRKERESAVFRCTLFIHQPLLDVKTYFQLNLTNQIKSYHYP